MLKENRTNILNHSWIQPYVKQNKKLLMIVILLGVLTVCSAGALMFTSGYLISKSATRPQNVFLVYIPIVLVRAFGIAQPVFAYVERLTSHNFVLKVLSKMRVRLYQKLENLPSQHLFSGLYKALSPSLITNIILLTKHC